MLGLAACGADAPTPPPSASRIVVTPDRVVLSQRDGVMLRVEVLDDASRPIGNAAVAFRIGNEQLAEMRADGFVVTGLATGTSTITVSSLGKSVSVPVEVYPKLQSVVLDGVQEVGQLDSLRLRTIAYDIAGNVAGGVTVVAASRTEAILRVTPSGLLASVGPVGEAVIEFSAIVPGSSVSNGARIAVRPRLSRLNVALTPPVISQGSSARFSAGGVDLLGKDVVRPVLTYVSSDTTVVAVTNDGVAYSTGGVGRAVITVRGDGAVATLEAVVSPPTRREWNPVMSWYWEDSPPRTLALSGVGGFLTSGGDAASWTRRSPVLSQYLPVKDEFAVAVDTLRQRAFFLTRFGASAVNLGTKRLLWTHNDSSGHHLTAIATVPGDRLVHAGDGDVFLLNATTGQRLWKYSSGAGGAFALTSHPSVAKVWVSWAGAGFVTELDLDRQQVRRIDIGSAVAGIYLSRDASRLYVLEPEGRLLHTFDAVTLQPVARLDVGARCFTMTASLDDTELYLGCSQSPEMVVIDRAGLRPVRRVNVGGWPQFLVATPDGAGLLVALTDIGIKFIK